jgi:hypothetical protein
MDISRWNRYLITVVLTGSLSIAVSNIVYDHYGVFRFGLVDRDNINLNQRFTKVRYLQDQPQHNAFHLGSSKLGHFPTHYHANLAHRTDSGVELDWYNLGVFSGMPTDYLKLLRWLVAEKREIGEVLIGLDYFAFFSPPDLNQAAFRHHPDVSGENRWEDIASYVYRSSFVYLLTEADYFFGDGLPPYRHDIPTGRYLPVRALQQLEENSVAYWKKEVARIETIITQQDRQFTLQPETVDALTQLRAWLESEGIHARFYVQPLHRLMKRQFGENAARDVTRALSDAGIESAWRFDTVECLGFDDRAYYDVQHYRPSTAMALLDVIYGAASTDAVCERRDLHALSGQEDTLHLLERLMAQDEGTKMLESLHVALSPRPFDVVLHSP